MSIPDDLARVLGEGFEDLGSAALEAPASDAYAKDVLSLVSLNRRSRTS